MLGSALVAAAMHTLNDWYWQTQRGTTTLNHLAFWFAPDTASSGQSQRELLDHLYPWRIDTPAGGPVPWPLAVTIHALALVFLLWVIASAVWLAYRWRGHPAYLQDLDRNRVCREMLRSSAPSFALLWLAWWPTWSVPSLLISRLAMVGVHFDLDYAPPTMLLRLAGFSLAVAIICAFQLRRAVTREVATTGELRCDRCGYLIHSSVSQRCPECGVPNPAAGQPAFQLTRARRPSIRNAALALGLTACMTTFIAPLIVPHALRPLPSTAADYLPQDWADRVGAPVANRGTNPNAFWITPEHVALVEHKGALGTIRFTVDDPSRLNALWTSHTAWWPAGADPSQTSPNQQQSLTINTPMSAWVNVGPWRFQYSAGSSTLAWIYRPNTDFSVRVVPQSEAAASIPWLND